MAWKSAGPNFNISDAQVEKIHPIIKNKDVKKMKIRSIEEIG
jgi:hypothetical protein